MSTGVILLLVSLAAIVVVWAGLDGIQVRGSLFTGMICITIGALAIQVQFPISLAFLVVGAGIFIYAIRSRQALKEFASAICAAIALVSGFYAMHFISK